jgi:hypothetical protein
MSRVETAAKVRVYEVDGEEQGGLEQPTVNVLTHWNRDEMVRLRLGNGKVYTVVADDLMLAIKRCSR